MANNDVWVDFVAGWCSGAAAVVVCQPVDTVLTRMQAFEVQSATGVARGLVSKAGVTSLWRGSSAMVSAVPCQNALLMAGYGAGKRFSSDGALLGVFLGGCTGGVIQSFLMSPVELIKVTQQVIGKSVVSATSSVAHGILSRNGAWRGLGATLLRDGIPHGVWFASYEWAKGSLEKHKWLEEQTHQKAIGIPLVSGAFAATTAWGIGYPFDLIKTRIQAASSTKGIVATAQELIQESGGRVVAGLYRGFTLKLLRAVPASAIGFVVYEFVKNEIS